VIFGLGRKTSLVSREDALGGRDTRPFQVDPTHVVLGTPIDGPWPEG